MFFKSAAFGVVIGIVGVAQPSFATIGQPEGSLARLLSRYGIAETKTGCEVDLTSSTPIDEALMLLARGTPLPITIEFVFGRTYDIDLQNGVHIVIDEMIHEEGGPYYTLDVQGLNGPVANSIRDKVLVKFPILTSTRPEGIFLKIEKINGPSFDKITFFRGHFNSITTPLWEQFLDEFVSELTKP